MVPKSQDSKDGHRPELGEFRLTKQRQVVYDVLMSKLDHPTANDVFMRVKDSMSSISLATVYNCLETLTQCGLVKQVNLDRAPSRYCANLEEHSHFYCTDCGEVIDVDMRADHTPSEVLKLPRGTKVDSFDIAIRGVCAPCSKSKPKGKS